MTRIKDNIQMMEKYKDQLAEFDDSVFKTDVSTLVFDGERTLIRIGDTSTKLKAYFENKKESTGQAKAEVGKRNIKIT